MRHPLAESRINRLPGDSNDSQRNGEGDSGRGRLTRKIAEVAGRQEEVVTLDDLRSLGMSSSGVHRRVQAGELFPKYPGVYAWGRPDLSPKGLRMAAVKACGVDACLSFASAAAHRGIRRSDSAYIDVTVPEGTPLRKLTGIRCHRAQLEPQDIEIVDGIRTTSVARTLLDLSTRFNDGSVTSAANEAVLNQTFDMREIENLLKRSKGHRGIRRLRRILESGDLTGEDQFKSGLERCYAELCKQRGLPKPGVNRWLLLGDEYHQVDFLWREQKVVIEVDSDQYHQTGWKLRRDAKVSALLLEHGFRHDRVPEDLIRESPSEAVEKAVTLLPKRQPPAESRLEVPMGPSGDTQRGGR